MNYGLPGISYVFHPHTYILVMGQQIIAISSSQMKDVISLLWAENQGELTRITNSFAVIT